MREADATPERLLAALSGMVASNDVYVEWQRKMRAAAQTDAAAHVVAVCKKVMNT